MSQLSRIIGTVEIQCPRCGHNQSYQRIMNDETAEFGECMSCGELTYSKQLKLLNLNTKPNVKCPYCGSTNTKKISTASKATSVALFGIFAANKVSKQWHCNNCKSDF